MFHKTLSGAILFVFLAALTMSGCGKGPQYQHLGQKAAEVDSLIIKAVKNGNRNIDSLRSARRDLAEKYILDLNPAKIDTADQFAAAKLFEAAGKIDTAIGLLETLKNGSVESMEKLFNAYLNKNKTSEAETLLREKLLARDTEKAGDYLIGLYYGYQEAGNLDKALSVVQLALDSLPADQSLYLAVEKAELLYEKGKTAEALAWLENLKAENENSARIQAKLTLLSLIGKPAPEINAQQWLDSKPMSIKDLRGKVVLLDFWATWCGPCRAMFPHLKKLYGEYHDKGLEIIGVTKYYGSFKQLGQNLSKISQKEELEWVAKFKQHHEIPFAYAIADDESAGRNTTRYGVHGIPHMVVIDRQGIVRVFAIGSGRSSEEKLQKGIEKYLTEQM